MSPTHLMTIRLIFRPAHGKMTKKRKLTTQEKFSKPEKLAPVPSIRNTKECPQNNSPPEVTIFS